MSDDGAAASSFVWVSVILLTDTTCDALAIFTSKINNDDNNNKSRRQHSGAARNGRQN